MLVCSALLYEGQLQKKVWTERRQIFTNDLIKALGNGEFFFLQIIITVGWFSIRDLCVFDVEISTKKGKDQWMNI